MAAAHWAATRRVALALLVLAVLLAHVWIGGWAADSVLELGAGAAHRGPLRMKALFVSDLRPLAPPTLAPQPAPVQPRRARTQPRSSAVVAAPASAPAAPPPAAAAAASAPDDPPQSDPLPAPQMAQAAAPEASAPLASDSPLKVPPPEPAVAAAPVEDAASSPPAAAGPPFEWPRSTLLSYRLSGNYRGPVEGQASVEWLRDGQRYQVHLEVSVGPSFAPLVSRRMSSDGEIGAQGLSPRRYDEETKVALRAPRRIELAFGGDRLRLANGTEQARPEGVQDTASQFVQLTWLFTTQPDRLRAGQSVELMLALPRRVDRWVYDVLGSETLHTPAGVIEAVHVRPRRPARPDGELTAEVWIAPTLQYLPVRIVIRQDAQTHVDLLLERLPQQAAQPEPTR